MSDLKVAFTDWKSWGAFRVPAVGVIVLTLLLLVGSLTNIEKAFFVQKVVIWVLGAGVIAYGHSLAHSTQKNLKGTDFKDLSYQSQKFAMACHTVWFVLFVVAALVL